MSRQYKVPLAISHIFDDINILKQPITSPEKQEDLCENNAAVPSLNNPHHIAEKVLRKEHCEVTTDCRISFTASKKLG
jgi:hypothetical protein